MAGGLFSRLWTQMGPYYTKAFPEVFVGLGLTTYLWYKISYGSKDSQTKEKPAH